jgi:hypothetical protein
MKKWMEQNDIVLETTNLTKLVVKNLNSNQAKAATLKSYTKDHNIFFYCSWARIEASITRY